jgi:hypothetical protein
MVVTTGRLRSRRFAGSCAVALCSALITAGCSAVSPAAGASGVEGIAEADPQCPISAPGAVCPPEPVSRTVAVRGAERREIARFTSAADGRFRVALPPGTYTLEEVVAKPPPSLKPVTVTVTPGHFVHVVLLFDTGIR